MEVLGCMKMILTIEYTINPKSIIETIWSFLSKSLLLKYSYHFSPQACYWNNVMISLYKPVIKTIWSFLSASLLLKYSDHLSLHTCYGNNLIIFIYKSVTETTWSFLSTSLSLKQSDKFISTNLLLKQCDYLSLQVCYWNHLNISLYKLVNETIWSFLSVIPCSQHFSHDQSVCDGYY